MIRILTVCLGNICRSPLAEEVLRVKCEKLGLSVFVDSAGTANYHIGSSPDSRMIQTAAKYGYNIKNLRARQFQKVDFDHFDYILTMDQSNFDHVIELAKNSEVKKKVVSYQEFADTDIPNFVPDPYYGSQEDFIETLQIVEASADRIAQKLKELHV